jgi:prepilin signal peptidase PulO-like enzyme (type II secretory pathway)
VVVEVTCALLFLLAYVHAGPDPVAFAVMAFYLSLSLVVFFTDLEHAVIPNALVAPGVLVALASAAFRLNPSGPSLALSVLGGILGGGVFMVIYWLTRGTGMGMGDVKLAFFMGFALGPLGLLLAILVGSLSGLLLAGFVMWRFRRELASLGSVPMHMDQEEEPEITDRVWGMMIINGKPAVPFGSFLSLGFAATLVFLEALFLAWFA